MNKMMNKITPVALLLAGLFSASSYADDSILWTGYARVGVITNDEGNRATNHDQYYDRTRIGRLGNEVENYFEVALHKSFNMANGSWAKFNLMITNDAGDSQHHLGMRSYNDIGAKQYYVEMGGIPAYRDYTFWAGNRFYRRFSAEVTDFFWNNYSGTGAGIEGLMNGRLNLAYIAGTDHYGDRHAVDGGGLMGHNVIASVFQGPWEFDMVASYVNGNDEPVKNPSGDHEFHHLPDQAVYGFQGNVIYNLPNFYNLDYGWSKFIAQAGYGLGAANVGESNYYYGAYKEDWMARFVTYGLTETKSWEVMPVLRLEYKQFDDSRRYGAGVDKDLSYDDSMLASLVVRPSYRINQNLSLELEAGAAYERWNANEGPRETVSYKLTSAIAQTLDVGFWAKPKIRAFVSYLGWEGDKQFAEESLYYSSDNGEFRLGVQGEVAF